MGTRWVILGAPSAATSRRKTVAGHGLPPRPASETPGRGVLPSAAHNRRVQISTRDTTCNP